MQKGEIMISTYDDEIDTITQIMIDWFTKRIRLFIGVFIYGKI